MQDDPMDIDQAATGTGSGDHYSEFLLNPQRRLEFVTAVSVNTFYGRKCILYFKPEFILVECKGDIFEYARAHFREDFGIPAHWRLEFATK